MFLDFFKVFILCVYDDLIGVFNLELLVIIIIDLYN